LQEVPGSVVELLQLSRGQVEFFATIQRRLLKELREYPELSQRVMRLQSIPGVGEILALSWALEVGEVDRFPSIAQAVSYCGLTLVRPLGADGKPRGGLWQVSASGGQRPLWSRDGRQLLFVSTDHHVIAVEYSVSGDSFQALKPRLWTETQIGTTSGNGPFDRSYDLTADGKRIITWDPDEVRDGAKTNLHITVLTNWFGEVERRFAHAGR
jgi:hypothetical protein